MQLCYNNFSFLSPCENGEQIMKAKNYYRIIVVLTVLELMLKVLSLIK